MQPVTTANETLIEYYTTAIDALAEIAHTYFFLGKLEEALHILNIALQISPEDTETQKCRLKLLLLQGRVLIVDHLLHRRETDLMFSTLLQAQELAESTGEQRESAEALNLLGQAYCTATTIAILKSGALPFGMEGQGKYDQALVCLQQSLKLQEKLHDTQGMCESLFGIGLIYQFWQQNAQAQEHFTRTIQLAEQHGHILEQAEPHRHLTMEALFKGDLDQALMHAQQALSFREAGGFKPYQPLDHLLLRDIYLKKGGDTDRAQFHLQQASAIAADLGMTQLIAEAINATENIGSQKEEA